MCISLIVRQTVLALWLHLMHLLLIGVSSKASRLESSCLAICTATVLQVLVLFILSLTVWTGWDVGILDTEGLIVQSSHIVITWGNACAWRRPCLRVYLMQLAWHLIKGLRVEQDLIALGHEEIRVVDMCGRRVRLSICTLPSHIRVVHHHRAGVFHGE